MRIKEKVHVGIFDHAVWKAWQPSKAYETFPHLYQLDQGLDFKDFDQVRPLLFGKKEIAPTTPGKPFRLMQSGWQSALLMNPAMKRLWTRSGALMRTPGMFSM